MLSDSESKSEATTCPSRSVVDSDEIVICQYERRDVPFSAQNGGGIPVTHYERLIEELKCPGCANAMKTPIFNCGTGHSVCGKCTRILESCPLCKAGFTSIRSLTLEAIASKAYFRCCNASGGCTVRLQPELLSWHEKQCMYKVMKCFMGRVWGNCTWVGQEISWKEHLVAEHSEKVFYTSPVQLQWSFQEGRRPLSAYYVFDLHGEMFNVYQIYDNDRILWTMACTSTVREKKRLFSYDVEIFNPDDETSVITQRFPCHSEYDKDILRNGTCVSVPLADINRMVSSDQILYYRIGVNKVKSHRKPKCLSAECLIPKDFKQTKIEGGNLKSVPSENIVTRKLEDEEDELSAAGVSTPSPRRQRDVAEMQEKWGTPQLNFNRKFLRGSVGCSTSSEDSGSTKQILLHSEDQVGSKREDSANRFKMRKMTSSVRKSLKLLKADLVELKSLALKSPERESVPQFSSSHSSKSN